MEMEMETVMEKWSLGKTIYDLNYELIKEKIIIFAQTHT